MTNYPEAERIRELVAASKHIVILQADNPDADSLGSALALENILGELSKQPSLYCGVDMPGYLAYLTGWSRVAHELPRDFDLAIIVDTSADSLFETLNASGQKNLLTSKPVIVLDHHITESTINFAAVQCNQPVVATGEVIYELAQQLGWPVNLEAKTMIVAAILSDSLGLTTEATSARSIHIIAELVEGGVSIPALEDSRRELTRKSPELTRYKGELLQRIEYAAGGRVATVAIPWREIETFSPLYNPSMLVIDDMRSVTGCKVAVSFKIYNDGHITGKIRCNYGYPIAAKLAEHFGGGGHIYASGFKIDPKGRPFNEIKSECTSFAAELLDQLEQEKTHGTVQHTDAPA